MSLRLDPLAECPATSAADWRRAAGEQLRSRPLASLDCQRPEGFTLAPIYPADRAPRSDGRRRPAPAAWAIAARSRQPDPARANAELLEGLANGASAVDIALCDQLDRPAPGLRVGAVADWRRALEGLHSEAVPVALELPGHWAWHAAALESVGPPAARWQLGADPAALLLGGGTLPGPAQHSYDECAAIAARWAEHGAPARALAADARAAHAAGADDAQCLAVILAAALEHLRAGERAGSDAALTLAQTVPRLALGAHLFAGVAQLRALRALWRALCSALAAEEAVDALWISAESSPRMLHAADPWVNPLRLSAAATAAAWGGADQLSLHAHDEFDGQLASPAGQRLSRNTQLILQHESGLHAVADPAGGAGYLEAWTDQLIEAAWRAFQQLEAEGGLLASLRAGALQARIATAAAAARERVAHGEQVLTGVSAYPPPEPLAAPGAALDWDAALSAARARWERPVAADGERVEAPPVQSLGADFEALRARAAAAGERARAALLCLGSAAQHGARASAASNLLAAGGLRAQALLDPAEPAAAWRQSGCAVAVICADDAALAARGADTVAALRAAGCAAVYCAGCSADQREALRAAGLAGELHSAVDAIAALRGIHHHLGIAP